MNKIKVSAVSYLNTKPFIYGIEKSGLINEIELSLDMPSVCAEKIIQEQVDIGLVPVAILPALKNYSIFSDYCIGAKGAVRSVMLFSNVPLHEIKSILLDYQSKTSVMLARILAERLWKISPLWEKAEKDYEKNISGNRAGVIIGDRALELSGKYKYSCDLAEEWMKLTSLPFVFACWVAKNNVPETFKHTFNAALKLGLANKAKVIKEILAQKTSAIDIHTYINDCISYELDELKAQGFNLFLEYAKQLKAH